MRNVFLSVVVFICFVSPYSAKSADFAAQYDVDMLKNTRGGISTGFEYIDLLSLSLSDQGTFEQGIAWNYYASAIYSNGHSFSADIVGDDHIVSNLEGGDRFIKLAEAFVNLQFEEYSVLLGLYDINGEFDVLSSANLFINSGYGIGNDIGLSGENGPSIYPFYGLSVRFKWQKSTIACCLRLRTARPGMQTLPQQSISV